MTIREYIKTMLQFRATAAFWDKRGDAVMAQHARVGERWAKNKARYHIWLLYGEDAP